MKKWWLSGLALLILIIVPVTADMCNPVPNTDFCTVSGTTAYTYKGIPFAFTILSNTAPDYLLVTSPGATDSRPMNGSTAAKIHFLDHAGVATYTSDGYHAGKIVVDYKDGTNDSVDLIIGVNIAEFAYDRPDLQSVLAHTKIPPAYSYSTNYDSAYPFKGHFFYSSITAAPKPIDRIELRNTANVVWLAIDAITLETVKNPPTVVASEATPTSFKPVPTSDSPDTTGNWFFDWLNKFINLTRDQMNRILPHPSNQSPLITQH